MWSPVEERRSADPICITTCRSRSSSQRRYGDQLLHAMRMRHKNGEQQKMDGEHGTTCHSLDEIDHRSRCSVAQHRAHFTGDGDVGQGKGLTPWRGQERRLCGRCVSHPPPFPPYSALYGRLHHQTNTTSPYLGPALPHPPSFLLVLSLSLSLDAGYCWWRGQRMPGGLGDSMSFAYLPCGNGCLSEGRKSQG